MMLTKTEPKKKRPNNLLCCVCGAPSRCHYFGAVCCESCKVFFRRAVLQRTSYKCHANNDCDISQKSRRCSACRLEKCKEVGMLEKWVINSPRVGKMKRRRETPEPKITRCKLVLSEEDERIVNEIMATSKQTIQDVPFPDEVFVDEPTFTHIINVFSIVVKRMIAFTKAFEVFKSLPMADQVVLLKSVSLEIMLTRKASSLLSKVSEKHGLVWMVENGKFLFSKADLARAYDERLYENYIGYITRLMKLKVDDNALVILTCVCMFSPDRDDLSEEARRTLECHQMYYVSLLERYLHSTFSCEKARKVFPKMLVSQWYVRETSHYFNQAAMRCSNQEIQPLMKEFFDLE